MQVWGDDPSVLKATQLVSPLDATIVGNLEHPHTSTMSISASSSLSCMWSTKTEQCALNHFQF